MKFIVSRTTNHGKYGQKIPRPVENAELIGGQWVIEINTLDELMAMYESAGDDLIISDGYIEIYDDYRE